MKPIDIIILVLVVGAMAAIIWRAIRRHQRAKTMPPGCAGCTGCSKASNGCAGCAYAQQNAPKGGGGGCH